MDSSSDVARCWELPRGAVRRLSSGGRTAAQRRWLGRDGESGPQRTDTGRDTRATFRPPRSTQLPGTCGLDSPEDHRSPELAATLAISQRKRPSRITRSATDTPPDTPATPTPRSTPLPRTCAQAAPRTATPGNLWPRRPPETTSPRNLPRPRIVQLHRNVAQAGQRHQRRHGGHTSLGWTGRPRRGARPGARRGTAGGASRHHRSPNSQVVPCRPRADQVNARTKNVTRSTTWFMTSG
jgi:hypothetical protein